MAIDTLTNNSEEARETLAKQNEIINEELTSVHSGSGITGEISEKKAFVEPAISAPVDVLEATTFFQVAESGATN
ncbi:MAG TPA: hypothetical protein VJM50_02680 [Pyrinomonadaceae bacterium]|nr:hypothetical protein [Pyrinomonadaceae bacterium]